MKLNVKLIQYTSNPEKVTLNLFMNCEPSCVNGSCSEGEMICEKLEDI